VVSAESVPLGDGSLKRWSFDGSGVLQLVTAAAVGGFPSDKKALHGRAV